MANAQRSTYCRRLLFYTLLTLSASLFAQENLSLPVAIPLQGDGIFLQSSRKSAPAAGGDNLYTLRYHIILKKKRRSSALLLTLPPSDSLQRSTLLHLEGGLPRALSFDKVGNPQLLIQDPREEIHLTLRVEKIPGRPFYPWAYTQDLRDNRRRPPSEVYKRFDSASDLQREILQQLQEASPPVRGGHPYSERVQNFFPLEDGLYGRNLQGIRSQLKETTGGDLRFSGGLLIPVQADYFLPHFTAALIFPGVWNYTLQANGRPFLNPRSQITLYYTENSPLRFPALLAGRISPDEPGIPDTLQPVEAEMAVRINKPRGRPPAKGRLLFTEWGESPVTGQGEPLLWEKPPQSLLSDERRYHDESAPRFISELELGALFQGGEIQGAAEEFSPRSQVTALIRLKKREARDYAVRWVTPTGKTYYTHQQTTGPGWGYFYTYITGATYPLTPGLWRVEVSTGGRLDYRREFLIQ